jgi:hypothetical protein
MPILEKDIEGASVKYARFLGYICLKVSPMGSRGWPDHLFINIHGVHIYIEFKRPGEPLKPLQEHRKKQLEERGCHVFGPVSDLQTAKGILDEFRTVDS